MNAAGIPPPSDEAVTRVRRKALFAVFFTIFLDLVGFGMFIPILPNVARDFSATPAEAASLNTYFSLGTLVAVAVLGRASDRFGRRKMLMATIALSAAAQLATGFAHSYAYLVVVRLVAGIAAGNISVAQACVSDITRLSERSRSMVLIGIAFGCGFAVGPAFGAALSRFTPDSPLQTLSFAACALNLCNLFLVSTKLPETHHRFAKASLRALIADATGSESGLGARARANAVHGKAPFGRDLARLLSRRTFAVLLLIQFLQVFGFVGIEAILPIVLKDAFSLGTERIFDAFLFIGVAVLLANGFVSRAALRRWSEKPVLGIGQLALGTGIALIAWVAPDASALWAALAVMSCGSALANPATSGLVSKMAPADLQGFAFGAAQTFGALARILGPLVMGILYVPLGGAPSLYVSAALIGVGFLLGAAFIRKAEVNGNGNGTDPEKGAPQLGNNTL